jgi:Dolichyl-phosphate-mannose-protein mannosyltransferase
VKDPDRTVDYRATPASETRDSALTSRIRIAAWILLTLAGLVEAMSGRHYMQDDGVSYLDMGDAMMRNGWKAAVNGHWSPLYPWLQGMALKLFKPSSYSQFSVVHSVDFLIYLFGLACFDFLLRAAAANRCASGDADAATNRLPEWAVFAIGYAIFAWSNLTVITIQVVNPDALMAAFLYLSVALLLRIWAHPQSFSRFLLLGAVLGIGYLAKAPMFPLAFVILTIAWILAGNWKKATPRVLAAALVFMAVSAPWIAALSQAKGRFMFGDSARFNYLLYIDGAGPNTYFVNLGSATGHYTHPVRKIFDAPPIYEFATPIKGTLPNWDDPSYWTDGAKPRFLLKRQLAVLRDWLEYYLDLIFTTQTALLVGFVVLCFMAARGRHLFLKQLAAQWPVWLIGLAGLGMFALVHVELRYVAAFFTLCWVGLFSGLNLPLGSEGRRLVTIVTVMVVIATAGPTAASVAGHLRQALRPQPHIQWQVAQDLRKLGVKPGDQVARLPTHFGLAWARLLRVTVVAQIPLENSDDFWCAKPDLQSQAIETIRRLGVTALVAEQTAEACPPGPDWHKVGDDTYYALKLDPGSAQAGKN